MFLASYRMRLAVLTLAVALLLPAAVQASPAFGVPEAAVAAKASSGWAAALETLEDLWGYFGHLWQKDGVDMDPNGIDGQSATGSDDLGILTEKDGVEMDPDGINGQSGTSSIGGLTQGGGTGG